MARPHHQGERWLPHACLIYNPTRGAVGATALGRGGHSCDMAHAWPHSRVNMAGESDNVLEGGTCAAGQPVLAGALVGLRAHAVLVQLNSKQCQVVYETGETEELQVDELIRDGIMSLGWVPAPGPARPDSAGQLSVAGVQLLLQHSKHLFGRLCFTISSS